MPRRSARSWRSGTPSSGMFTECRAVPEANSTTEGTPRPTASAVPAARMAPTSCSTSACVEDVSVWWSSGGPSVPPSSDATEIFVPPTSTPMTRRTWLTGDDHSLRPVAAPGLAVRRAGEPWEMPSLLPPSVPVSQAGRAAHDLGLAGLLGGTLFGRLALHPAVTAISDPRERGEVVNAAWRRYGLVNGLGLAALVGGWAGARAAEARGRELSGRERRLARAKDALVGATALAGLASAVEGVRFSRTAPDGAVPLRDGDHTTADASPASRALKARLNALGTVTLAAEAGLVAVNAALAQEGFRRPPVRRRLPWSRT